MSDYRLSIITPEGKIFDESVNAIVAQGSEGSFGVLANHTPIVSMLNEGLLKIKTSEKEMFYQIGSGVLEVNDSKEVLILADFADVKEEAK